ncbi:MAG TPA: VTT domain-containing protein [Candidatus Limnocylindrales bacterium]|nr:VTT domain-containing protein [Candidatus Limnocylindrales bacterium]
MEAVQPYLDWFADHRFAVVFVASLIDATGLPFPGRLLLVLAGALAAGDDLGLLILLSAGGSVIGDHALYGAGAVGGSRVLDLYCRISLGSERCVETAIKSFKRFGAAAVLIGRFSFSVRLFAAVMAGAGRFGYGRFLGYDIAGSVIYATLWLGAGYIFGTALMDRLEAVRVLLFLGPAAIVALLLFRLARRWRYGHASTSRIRSRREGW